MNANFCKIKNKMEYLCLLAEIESLKFQLEPRNNRPVRIPCPHVTSKGHSCKKYCLPGLESCKVHSKPPKPPKVVRVKSKRVYCTGLNMRGNPCKRKCVDGETYCERHDPSLPVKEKLKRVGVKRVPEHNHAIGEVGVGCDLCDTHGDIFDSSVTMCVWIDDGSFKA